MNFLGNLELNNSILNNDILTTKMDIFENNKFNNSEIENDEDDTKSYFMDSDNPELPDQQFDDTIVQKIDTIKKV